MPQRFQVGRFVLVALWNKTIEFVVLAKVRVQRGTLSRADRWALARIHAMMLRQIERMEAKPHTVIANRGAVHGVHNNAVNLREANPGWLDEAAREIHSLRTSIGENVEVHHVGSTAVDALAAKPIIDLAMALPAEKFAEQFPLTRERLLDQGYRYLGVRGGYFFEKAKNDVRTHALQVHRIGSPELMELLRFRDALRDDPSLRFEYAAIKTKLATAFPRRRLLYVSYKFHWIAEWQWRTVGAPDWATWFAAHKFSQSNLAKLAQHPRTISSDVQT